MNLISNDDSEYPVFSIITVCYNSEKTIFRTIKSVLNQTFKNFEYIIVDGKSSDNTLKIVKEAESEFQGRLKIISENDNGIYDAMNKGIEFAKGKLIGIINSDDWYELDALDLVYQVAFPDLNNIIYGLMRYYRDGKEFQIQSFNHEFLNERMINHPTCFVPKKLYETVGNFNVKYKLAADYDFILRCKNMGTNFKHIPSIISNMTMEGTSLKNFYQSQKETFNILFYHGHISNTYRVLRLIDIKIKLFVKSILIK